MAEREPGAEPERDHVIDLTRATPNGPPPVPGAQWDELHGRWEVWNDTAQVWEIIGDDAGIRAAADDSFLPPLLARELFHAREIDPIEHHVIDLDRAARPPQPVPGAQWNEVQGRWERWDEAAGAWIEARADAPSDVRAP